MKRLRIPRAWLLLLYPAIVAVTLTAQGQIPPVQPALTSNDPLVGALRWRNIGNANLIGRISAIDALESDFTHVIVGSASGGVFKSVNAGTSWTPIFDNYGAASIGDVAIFQKDPNIIWVGTGEECGRNSAAWGDGLYKSTDGGATFRNVGLKESFNIGKIVLHPANENVVYVAAIGNAYAPVGERGLYKTLDGGVTWTKLAGCLPDHPGTGALDLRMDASNAETAYVTV